MVARNLGVHMRGAEVSSLAARYLAAGLPGGPYPTSVPPHVAELYAGRDLCEADHRAAYVGLLSTVRGPHERFADALYEEVLRPETWTPYADAADVVTTLAEHGIRVGLVSNVAFDLRPILSHHGFPALARHCTLSYEHGFAKPHPELFRAALASVQATAGEALMVGDHPEADGGAAAVGIEPLILPMSPPGAVHGLDRVLRRVL